MKFDAKFGAMSLAPVIVQDGQTQEVIMFAWANSEALEMTHNSGLATFYSRSRNEIWVKGATSGNYLHIEKILEDCDQDALLYIVKPEGPACHTGKRTCFHKIVNSKENSK
jgi:phosphoribosyl-ATP pyrophosphohydrolase/phosphoribosyl-AMP cyclohydrolase